MSSDLWTQISASHTVDFPVESSLQSAALMKSSVTTNCDVGRDIGFAEKWLISNVLIVYNNIYIVIKIPKSNVTMSQGGTPTFCAKVYVT